MEVDAAVDQDKAPPLPQMTVTWDATTQGVGLKFDPKDFKNWDFVEAVLKMAIGVAKQMQSQAHMQAHQQRALQAAEAERMRRKIIPGIR
jgi:hypothetical protein